MTNEQKQVKDWMQAFGQETPEKPTIPSVEVRKLRAKLILEEALETIYALGVRATSSTYDLISGSITFNEIIGVKPNLVEIADGCSDLSVVNYGTLAACGLVKDDTQKGHNWDPLFDEVMRSNWTKLWTHKDIQDVINGVNLTSLGDVGTQFHNKYDVIKVSEDKWLVKSKDGKVIKSPSYSPANLTPIINEMS